MANKSFIYVYFRALSFWWQINSSNIEHVRVIIDPNQESDQNNNTPSFQIVSFRIFRK